jgi:hypothetical protein
MILYTTVSCCATQLKLHLRFKTEIAMPAEITLLRIIREVLNLEQTKNVDDIREELNVRDKMQIKLLRTEVGRTSIQNVK